MGKHDQKKLSTFLEGIEEEKYDEMDELEPKELEDPDLEEDATSLDSQDESKAKRLAALISKEVKKSGSELDKESLEKVAQTLLFGDISDLNLKVAGDEEPDENSKETLTDEKDPDKTPDEEEPED